MSPPTLDSLEKSPAASRPYELFEFTQGASVWRFTGIENGAVSFAGHSFTPAAIHMDAIESSVEAAASVVPISVAHDNPVAMLFDNGPPELEVTVVVYHLQRDSSDSYSPFSGSVVTRDVEAVGEPPKIESKLICAPLGNALSRGVPRLRYQFPCNLRLYKCGVVLATFTFPRTVSAISALTVTVSAIAKADHYFDGGYAQLNTVATRRKIISQVGGLLTLSRVFPAGTLAVADTLKLVPGCDHFKDGDCRSVANGGKFDNQQNALAFVKIPGRDPHVGTIEP